MGWCWYLKIALGTCKQEAPSQEGGRSLAESIRAPQYLTPHFLTNVTELLRAPSFSFRGCLWSSFFFFSNFAFQTSHFLCLCIKRKMVKTTGAKSQQNTASLDVTIQFTSVLKWHGEGTRACIWSDVGGA